MGAQGGELGGMAAYKIRPHSQDETFIMETGVHKRVFEMAIILEKCALLRATNYNVIHYNLRAVRFNGRPPYIRFYLSI